MRAGLWPHALDRHPREIDAYVRESGDGTAAFVAEREVEAGLVGFIEVRLRQHADGCSSSPVAYIEGWYVDPDVRRSGVGSALLRAAEQWAADLGVTEMASDCQLENEIGQRAHAANCFQEVGRVVQYRKPIGGTV